MISKDVKNLTLIFDKTFRKPGIEGIFFNSIENIYKKTTANIILNGDNLESFPIR